VEQQERRRCLVASKARPKARGARARASGWELLLQQQAAFQQEAALSVQALDSRIAKPNVEPRHSLVEDGALENVD